jgi:predicted acyl esterase
MLGLHPDPARSVNPPTRPQYPFDEPPTARERSEPTYPVTAELGVEIPAPDGVRLMADVFRPYAPGRRFPALVAYSPYTRLLQSTVLPSGQNEAGITEFWVPRGYVHVIVDARGTGDSEGVYDLLGPTEQRDVCEVIEWAAVQPWCDGNVGMVGCSYFAMIQLLAAIHRPPSLKAIFPYDGATDLYREFYSRGGAPTALWFAWLSQVAGHNIRGSRLPDPSGIVEHARSHLRHEHPTLDDYWLERSACPRLGEIDVPAYFGCEWSFQELHLRGAFEGWERTGAIPKRLLIGPRPEPYRVYAAYHGEALRWYDQWLKGMDTGVMEGAPIRLYDPATGTWRGEEEWPLARTRWQTLFLSAADGDGALTDEAGSGDELSWRFDPHSHDLIAGRPCLTYRSEPFAGDVEVTGHVALHLDFSTTGTDADVYARLYDEAPDGTAHFLCKGALRASHRGLDDARSTETRPYHHHRAEEPVAAGEVVELAVELWPTCNTFRAGHRVRLEIAASDTAFSSIHGIVHQTQPVQLPDATHSVHHGRSRLLLPTIPA